MNARLASKFRHLLWIMALLPLLVSCSPVTRYRVLSFFFDGVQQPPELAVQTLPLPTSAPTAASRPGIVSAAAAPQGSRHIQFSTEECSWCHNAEQSFEPKPINADTCYRCHGEQARKEDWNHGPINEGNCRICHNAHESPNPHLLARPMPELCLYCHTSIKQGAKYYHPDLGIRSNIDLADCAACHNPHHV